MSEVNHDWGQPRRRLVSAKQIRANQENSRHSTGPRTPEGRERSSRNSLKHGCYAGIQPIDRGHLQETEADIQALIDGFTEALKPFNRILHDQIVLIATCRLRLDRHRSLETLALTEITTRGITNPVDRSEILEDVDVLTRAAEVLRGDLETLEDHDWELLLIAAAMCDPGLAALHQRLDPDRPETCRDHAETILASLCAVGLSPIGASQRLDELAQFRSGELPDANKLREAAAVAASSARALACVSEYSRILQRLTAAYDAELRRYHQLRKLCEEATPDQRDPAEP